MWQLFLSCSLSDIITEAFHLTYNKQEFTGYGLTIRMKQNQYAHHAVWHYGEEGINLKGTARTLDKADGEIPLENGILSKSGYALLDDSHSLVMTEDGFVRSALNGHVDLYFFGYGRKYLNCLADFYHLCGSTPMLPRFALGNWWSRYYAYSDMEYEQDVYAKTPYHLDWNKKKEFQIDPPYGNLSVIPSSRNYTLHFYGITSQEIEKISVNGEEIFVNTNWDKEKNRVTVSLKEIKREDRVRIYFQSGAELASNQILWRIYEILNRAQISYAVKEKLYAIMKKKDPIECKMTGLLAVDTLPELKEMISEIAFASLH